MSQPFGYWLIHDNFTSMLPAGTVLTRDAYEAMYDLLDRVRTRLLEEEDISPDDIQILPRRRPTLILFKARHKHDPAWTELFAQTREAGGGNNPRLTPCMARTPTVTCRSERRRLDPPLGTQWTVAIV